MICWSTAKISHRSSHISTLTEKAQKHLNSQGNLRRAKFPCQVQEQWKIKRKLAQDREAQEWVIRSIQKIYWATVILESPKNTKRKHHPNHSLLLLLLSKTWRSICSRVRLQSSFPQTVIHPPFCISPKCVCLCKERHVNNYFRHSVEYTIDGKVLNKNPNKKKPLFPKCSLAEVRIVKKQDRI